MRLNTDTDIGLEPEPSLRARRQHQTRDRLYHTAVELFAARPYDEVTVDEICQRAEVGRATFFRFYGSKGGILTEFSHRLTERIAQRLEERPELTATEQLWVVQEEVATAWGLSTPFTRSLAREWVRNATARDLKDSSPPELLALVANVVRRGQESGEFTGDYDPDFVAWIILASFSSITAGWLDTEDDESLVRGTQDAVSLLLAGLRGRNRG